MHLVIAIPTLNRCKYLKNNIHFFDQQRRPANIRVSLAISNSASVDGTESFLSELQNSRTDLFLFNRQTGYNGSNYGYLCTAIPMTLIGSGLWVTTTISMIARQLQVFVRFSRITIMMTNLLFYMPVKLVDQEILVLSPSKTFRRFVTCTDTLRCWVGFRAL